MLLARNLERNGYAIVRHKSHLTFNHSMKYNRMLPKSLQFTPPIKCQEGYKIAKKAGMAYLRLRISHSHNKLQKLQDKQQEITNRLTEQLASDTKQELLEVIQHNTKRLAEKIKAIHKAKLTAILGKNKRTKNTNIDKSRWVINVSDRQLNTTEIQVLNHGFNFAITPRDIPTAKIVACIESGIKDLNQTAKDTIRVTVTNILKHAKPSKTTNIPKAQNKALLNLKKDKEIIILPADKGKAVVVMNRKDYEQKLNSLLSDTKTYEKITDKRRNPTTHMEKDLNKLLFTIKKADTTSDETGESPQLPPRLYHHLHSTDATPAAFYGVPKVHKTGMPLRPITSSIGAPTYNLSKYLASILSPLLHNKYSVNNSAVFAMKINNQRISPDEIMVSFDVVSLFTSIPVNEALRVTNQRIQEDATLDDRTSLSPNNIMRLLEFTLNNSYFTANGEHYRQCFGCAMGSPVSAVLANLVMEEVEEKTIATAPTKPKWWYRYVDDSHTCLKRDKVQEFHIHLNSINPHIQFTLEIEENNSLPFLDTLTTRVNHHIKVEVYRKPTHTDRYLDFHSHHPIQHKKSVVNTLMDRANKIPSTLKGKQRERNRVNDTLLENNYPPMFIKQCEKAKTRSNQKRERNTISEQTNRSQPNRFVTIPYVQGVSEKIGKALSREGVKVAYKPIRTISQVFPRPKDRLADPQLKRNVVYKIPCKDCEFVYHGQTKRSFKKRKGEHRDAAKNQDPNSKLARHVNNTGHSMDFENATIVTQEPNFNKRLFLEAWYSTKDKNSGNDYIKIPDIYRPLIEQ